MKAIESSTPRKETCPFSKKWWNNELTKARKDTNKARNKFRRSKMEENKKIWKSKEKIYRKEIKKDKRMMWRKFVKEVDEKTICKLKRYIDSDTPQSSFIPTINETASSSSNDDKAKIIRATFFPLPPPADLSNVKGIVYLEPVPSPLRITTFSS
jgi:hypothetical protein